MEKYTNEQLCAMIREDNEWAKNQLIRQNEGFIRMTAGKFYRKYMLKHDLSYDDFKDMIQEGRIALLKAAETYETGHGAGFLSYAKTFLFHAAADYIRRAERSEKAKTAAGNNPPEKIYSITESDFDPYRFTPEQIYLRKEEIQLVRKALASCPPRYQAYLLYRFGFEDEEEHSLKDTAEHFHLNESQARKVEKMGLKYMRKRMHE